MLLKLNMKLHRRDPTILQQIKWIQLTMNSAGWIWNHANPVVRSTLVTQVPVLKPTGWWIGPWIVRHLQTQIVRVTILWTEHRHWMLTVKLPRRCKQVTMTLNLSKRLSRLSATFEVAVVLEPSQWHKVLELRRIVTFKTLKSLMTCLSARESALKAFKGSLMPWISLKLERLLTISKISKRKWWTQALLVTLKKHMKILNERLWKSKRNFKVRSHLANQ